MRFGIYPGGPLGTDDGTLLGTVPDVPATALRRIDALRGDAPFHVRTYAGFTDERRVDDTSTQAPVDARAYITTGCRLDLVLQYQSASGDVEGYHRFVRTMIGTYGPLLDTVQIGEEVNVTDNPTLDGFYPRALEAVVSGTLAAGDEIREHGLRVAVGTNTTVLLGDPGHYERLVAIGGRPFRDALDYVGLDAFPDTFAPLPPGADPAAVCGWLLAEHRRSALVPAGLEHLPLHVTEHGWPTGPDRPAARQAELLRAMVTAALDPAADVTSYTHFSLRDATDDGSLFGGFGLTDVDYSPKPAFATYAELVRAHA